MKREVELSNNSKFVDINEAKLSEFIQCLDDNLETSLLAPKGDLSIAVFDEEMISKLHADFLNDPSDTDVITFDGDDFDFAGEICVNAQRALKLASQFNHSPSKELSLYIAHGYLHLAGIDDIAPEDALIMRASEKKALDCLEKFNLCEIFDFKKD
ncbi:MAG: rRNA maturation RNase YbeY [Opitutales bacterium]